VRFLPGVQIANIDDLHVVIDREQAMLDHATADVRQLIRQHCADYLGWIERKSVVDIIRDTRTAIESTVDRELKRTLRRMRHGSADSDQIIEEFAHRVAQKLLHQPTVYLKASVKTPHASMTQTVIRALFQPQHPRPRNKKVR
jgi:glutamyl-tRNA reductase